MGQSSDLTWMSPERGLWVATRSGEHAGVVERRDGVYHARNAHGRAMGSFDELDAARSEVAGRRDRRSASRGVITKVLWAVNAVAVACALALAFVLFR